MDSRNLWIRRAAVSAGALVLGAAMVLPLEFCAQEGGTPGGDEIAIEEGGRGGRGGGSARAAPEPVPEVGFQQIFDGKTLNGWRGEEGFWRVENGVIVGQTTEEHPTAHSTFLIWEGGRPGDFELKIEFRFTGESGNSGIQYRSDVRTDREGFEWGLAGYQGDMTFDNSITGMVYEGGPDNRGFAAPQGYFTVIETPAEGETAAPMTIGTLGDAAEIAAGMREQDWNEMHVLARGNMLTHLVNGRVVAMLIDNDTAHRRMEGLIGIQLHGGDPMRVELRNIRIKNL